MGAAGFEPATSRV